MPTMKATTKKKRGVTSAPDILQQLKPGTTIQELADETGLDQSSLSRIFSGNRIPGGDSLNKIARSLGMSMDQVYSALPTG